MTKADKTKNGILYVILIELEGKPLVKIGVTHRSIEDRVVEILTSIFKRYTTAKKFSGHTEFFDVPLEDVVTAYEKLLSGKDKPVAKT